LVTTLLEEPFMKRGFHFISPAKILTRNKYILVVTNHVTMWVEAKALRTNILVVITRFVYEYILTKFGCLLTIVIDQGVPFTNDTIKI
jgi:hypothetical protein